MLEKANNMPLQSCSGSSVKQIRSDNFLPFRHIQAGNFHFLAPDSFKRIVSAYQFIEVLFACWICSRFVEASLTT